MWTAIAMLVAGALSAIGTLVATNNTNQANKEIHDADNAFNAAEAEKANNRDLQNLVEAPGKSMEGFAKAGVNPLLAITGGDFKLPKASAASAASPLAMESYSPMFQQLQQGATGAITQAPQIENVKADTQLKQAQANRLAADTHGIELDNQFKQRTLDTRVEAQAQSLNLSRTQQKVLDKQIDEREAHIQKLIAEAKTEGEKRELFQAQKILANVSATKIAYMMQYEKLLVEAQTDAQKASAALSYAQAAYQKRLVDSDYITAMVDELRIRARSELQGIELTKAQEGLATLQKRLLSGDFTAAGADESTWLGKLSGEILRSLNVCRIAIGGINGSIDPISSVGKIAG